MTETDAAETEGPKPKSKLPLVIGLVLALVGGGGGFFAVYSGMLLSADVQEEKVEQQEVADLPDISFVELEPLTISLFDNNRDRHLRFRAHLETPSQHKEDVAALAPRIMDVMNTYLRAVEVEDLKSASALVRLRGQMLRRVQVVVGEGRVNDLLVMEFVLN